MKKLEKIICITAAVFMLGAGTAFSQDFDSIDSTAGLTEALDSFSAAMVNSLPFNSTIGLNWSDAHIGKFFPSMPPHFGLGLSLGATTIPIAALSEITDALDISLPSELALGIPLPAYTADVRIGGFFLPFDIGVKFGIVPQLDLMGIGLDYLLVGADFRYQVLDLKLMKVSVGIGFNHLSGGLTQAIGSEMEFPFEVGEGTDHHEKVLFTASQPELGLKWETNVLELKAHVSFPFLVITPYAGFGMSYAWSKTGYGVYSDIEIYHNDIPASPDDVREILNELGISGLTENGFEQLTENSGWNFRLYGGFSLNLTVIRLDFTIMYNLMDSGIGGTFGIRFQL